jgi:hypothetical protein
MAEPAGLERVTGVRVLALCGESLLIEAIEASLRDREGVEIILLDTSQPGAAQILDSLSPDIILFDLTSNQMACVFPILRTHTDIVMIGLNLDRDMALILSGEWRILPSLADLMQVIEGQIQIKNSKRL